MKLINWNKEKNTWLKENRGVNFEDILYYLDKDFLIDDIEHSARRLAGKSQTSNSK